MAPRECLLMTLDCVPHQVRETLAEAALALEAERADKAEAETAAVVAEEAVARMAQLAERGDQERVLQLSSTVAELARWQTSAHAAWEEAGREVKRRQETELLEQAKQSAIVDLRARALIDGASSRASPRGLVEGGGRVQGGGYAGTLPVGTSTMADAACAGCTAGAGSTPRLSCSAWEQLQLSQLQLGAQLGACSGSVGAETGGQTGSGRQSPETGCAGAALAFAAWATAPSNDVAASAELTAAREVLQGYQAMSRQQRDPIAPRTALGGGEQLRAQLRTQLMLTPEGAARAQHGETPTSSGCSTRSLTTGSGQGLSSLARSLASRPSSVSAVAPSPLLAITPRIGHARGPVPATPRSDPRSGSDLLSPRQQQALSAGGVPRRTRLFEENALRSVLHLG